MKKVKFKSKQGRTRGLEGKGTHIKNTLKSHFAHFLKSFY